MPQNQLSKIVASTDLGDATTWVGQQGTLFWDPATTTLRISDGSTAGGVTVGGAGLGYLTLPSRNDTQFTIGGGGTLDGIKMTTDRGTVKFGNTPECVPTGNTHFHIMKQDPTLVDLFFGDDFNYLLLPAGNETVVIGTSGGYTWTFDNNGNLTFPTPGNGTVSNSAGYLGLPQNSRSSDSYTLHNYDQGNHVYLTRSGSQTLIIPSNSDIPFAIGTTILLVTSGNTTATIEVENTGSDTDTVIQAGTGTSISSGSGNFTLSANGMATLLKITETSWMISGAGLS